MCWYIKSLVVCTLFSCMYMRAGRVYYFDKERFCAKVDAASSWHELLPHVTDQVRLLLYCAERDKENLHNYEYFERDWDEPLVAAGYPKSQHASLVEWIKSCSSKDLCPIGHFVGDKEWNTWRWLGLLYKGACIRSISSSDRKGLLKQENFHSLYKAALDDEKVAKKRREEKFEQLCGRWLTYRGRFNIHSPAVKIEDDLLLAEECRKEFLTIAHSIRWLHEYRSKGMYSFICYLSCSEKIMHSGDESSQSALCRSLAALVNSHLDMYGVPSSLKEQDEQDHFFLLDVKGLVKDSAQRLDEFLAMTFVNAHECYEKNGKKEVFKDDSGETYEEPYLDELSDGCHYSKKGVKVIAVAGEQKSVNPYLVPLSQSLMSKRALFAQGALALLNEQEPRPATPRRGCPSTPTRSIPRPADWRPPTEAEKAVAAAKEAVEKLWNRFQLIDEIRFGVDPEESHSVTEFPGGQMMSLSSPLTPEARPLGHEALPANVFLVPPTSHDTEVSLSAEQAKIVLLAQRVASKRRSSLACSAQSSGNAHFSTRHLLPSPPSCTEGSSLHAAAALPPYDNSWALTPPPSYAAALPPYDNSWALGGH